MGIQINGQTDTVTAADGSLNLGGNVTIPGVLTYEDVTSVDSVGVVTARSGINITGTSAIGNEQLQLSWSSPNGAVKVKNTVGSPAANLDLYSTDTSGNTNLGVRLQYTGNVGIGTDNPTTKLYATDTQNGYVSYTFVNDSNGSGAVNRIQLGNDASPGSAQLVVYGSQHSTLPNVFDINNANNSDMRLLTNNTERLRINSTGNVGIGTDNPATKLHLSSGTATQITVSNTSSSMSDGDTMGTLDFAAGPSHTVNARVAGAVEGTSEAGGDLVFETRADGGSLTERLRINSSGNVGIGTVPQSWSGFRSLQLGGTTSIWSVQGGQAGSSFYSNNIYFDGSNRRYLTSNAASEYIQDASTGNHIFYGVSSGTAGNTLSGYTEVARFTSSGLKLPSGNGIDFSATSDAAGATSELLDDYEEGTWTPTFYLGDVLQTYNVDIQNCTYTRIGRIVHLEFWTGWGTYGRDAFPSSSGSIFEISGIPYSAGAFYGASMGQARTQAGTSANLGLSILYNDNRISFTNTTGNFGSWYGLGRLGASSISGSTIVVIAGSITYRAS